MYGGLMPLAPFGLKTSITEAGQVGMMNIEFPINFLLWIYMNILVFSVLRGDDL